MVHSGARLFFGMLAILAGAIIVIQVLQFQGISGASVQEEGIESGENTGLRVRELSAFQDGAIVEVRFLIESEREGEVSVAYTLEGKEGAGMDAQGTGSVRKGEQRVLIAAGVPSLQRLRLSVPEAQEQGLFLTLGVSDGTAFAYRRVVVRAERGKENRAVGQSALAIPLSLIGVMVLVGGYVAWYVHHRRQMMTYVHRVQHHVSVQHERALR